MLGGLLSAIPLWGLILLVLTGILVTGAGTALLLWNLYGPSFDSITNRDRLEQRGATDKEVLRTDGGEVLPERLPTRVKLDPPRITSVRVSILTELYRWMVWKWNRKRLVQDGYIQWILLDGTFPSPQFVRPERNGDGIPVINHDGETYLAPENALIPDEQQGAWTVIHRKGQADPINPHDQDELAIPADALNDYASRTVLKESAGGLGINPKLLVYGGIAVMILLVVAAYAMMQTGVI
jgi:hypothetical protein